MTGSTLPEKPPVVITVPLNHVNAYIVRGNRTILVDTGLPGSGPAILSALRKNSIDPHDISLIIITHAHLDHFGSAAFLKKSTGAPVLAGALDAGNLEAGLSRPPVPVTLTGRLMALLIGKEKPSPDRAVVSEIAINAPFDLSSYGIEGTIIPVPGHTKGSLCVLLRTGECFAGDLVMGMAPASRPRLPIFAEDEQAARESLRSIAGMNIKIIYPGHGGPFTPEQIRNLGV